MRSPTRVLLLELDAAEQHLLLDWAAAGILPTFQSLLDRGLVGHCTTPPGVYVGAVWPSLFTGVNPARHGIHSLAQLKPGTYEVSLYTPDQVKHEAFWGVLSRAGRRIAVLDVPLSGITPGLNGIQIVEWGSHDSVSGFSTWPSSLARDVVARFGRHPLEDCNADRTHPSQFLALRDDLIRGVRKKTELTKHYLGYGNWDFFAQVFTESHCIGHQCWHLHDRNHPGYDPAVARLTGDLVQDVYVAIDAALGEILAEVGQDTRVIVLAGHGMGGKRGAQFLLDEVLVRLGAAAPAREEAKGVVQRLDAALSWTWQRTPATLKQALHPLKAPVRRWIDGPSPLRPSTLDPARGKCFLVENHFAVGGIRLNVLGREPDGLLRPGRESDAFADDLERDLLEVKDVATGKPAIERVLRTRDLYRGDYLDHLPDLLVEWSTEVPLGTAIGGKPGGGWARLTSPKIGLVEGENRYCRTGEHLPDGLFVAAGAGIGSGRLDRPVSIMDFAPTISSWLGVDLPDIDGKPIAPLLGA